MRNTQPYGHPLCLHHTVCRKEKAPHQNTTSYGPKTAWQGDKRFAHTSEKKEEDKQRHIYNRHKKVIIDKFSGLKKRNNKVDPHFAA